MMLRPVSLPFKKRSGRWPHAEQARQGIDDPRPSFDIALTGTLH
jgi:hypothetical protein